MTLRVVLCLVALTSFTAAQSKKPAAKPAEEKKDEKPAPMSSETFNGLKLRLIGPALTSGRVNALAVDPRNPSHFYAGVASGGI